MHKNNGKHPLVSVIILTYNTKDITLTCLNKLKKSIDFLGQKVETVVVENGTDGTGEVIKKSCSWVKLIEPKENTGFAKGQNIGIANADKNSKYYLLLNSDAYVEEKTLKASINFMEVNKNCDVLGCKLVFADGSLQPSAGYLPSPITIVTWALGLDLIPGINRALKPFHPNYNDFFKSTKKVGWVTGAFMFMKNQVIKATKGFDENYFMYGEEIEWCKRINDSGFNIWYTPKFKIVHLFSASSGSTRNAFLREIEGVYYFVKKYYPMHRTGIKLVVKTGMFLRAFTFHLIGNSFRAKVHWDAMKI